MTRRYDDWITNYLAEVVPKSEAPERFHFWVAASIIAGALRRRVYIDMEAFRWHPNLFVVLVGPPGTVKKSTTINVGARLLRDVPNINFGSDVTTWEGFMEEVEQAIDMFAEGAPASKLSVDTSYEGTCALTQIISEWGTFLDPQNYNMINMLTELYDGKDIPLRKKTKTQGNNNINKPFINMIAGTTPSWMSDNFKGKFGGWGFSSRCIFLYSGEPERIIPYPDEEWKGAYRTTMNRFLHDLIEISEMAGSFTLTPEARDYGRDWYATHMARKIELDRHPHHNPWLSYYLARKFDHAHKLAMILAASRGNSLLITPDILRIACARTDEVELELTRIFGTSHQQTQRARLNEDVWKGLANIITQQGAIHEHNAFGFTVRYMAYGEAKDLFAHLVNSRWLEREVDERGIWFKFGEEAPIAARPQP
jgi:Protein of unknown function (DUF3987)